MKTLVAFKKQLVDLLVYDELRRLFYILRQHIDNQSNKHDDLCLIHAQYTTASHDQNIKGILTTEDARVIFNKIKASLLELINSLEDEDLCKGCSFSLTAPEQLNPPSPSEKKTNKSNKLKGQILYRIPGLMEIKKQYKCIVRIAFSEEELEYLNKQDKATKVEPIRVAQIMEVQFIDTNHCNAFNIKPLTNPEQLIDQGDFTEWIFYVETLLEGTYDLMLKVSVIEKRYDREVRKDIVLEKKITVVAEEVNQDPILGKASAREEQSPTVAGNALWLAGGFETMDVPFVMDPQPFIPLNPNGCAPPPPPPPPVDIFSWPLLLKIAGVLIVGCAAYYLWPNDDLSLDYSLDKTLSLNILGNNPPFKLTITNNESDKILHTIQMDSSGNKILDEYEKINPSSGRLPLGISLIDNKGNKKDTIIDVAKLGYKGDDGYERMVLSCRTLKNKKMLDVNVLNGKMPIEITVKKNIPNSPVWKFALEERRRKLESYENIDFLDEGNFLVTAIDSLNYEVTSRFTLEKEYLPPSRDSKLKFDYSHDAKNATIKITILEGEHPPFKIFIDGKQEATLKTLGSYYRTYRCEEYKDGQQITIKASNNQDQSSTKNLTLKTLCTNSGPSPDPISPTPIPIPCVNFESFNGCTILYVYKKATPHHWKMKTQTLNNILVKRKLLDDFNIYFLDVDTIDLTCSNKELVGLKNSECDVTTFIFNGKNKKHQRYDCFISPEKMEDYLACNSNPPAPPSDKGKSKTIPIRLTKDVTYLYKKQKDEGLSLIKSVPKTEKYLRIQVASFSEDQYFEEFMTKLDSIGFNEVYVRIDKKDNKSKVYLGNFSLEEQGKAKQELLKLEKNTKLMKIINIEMNGKMMVKKL